MSYNLPDSSGYAPESPDDLAMYRPQQEVLLDLAKVYPVEPATEVVPGAVDLQATVPARLAMRARTTTGHKIGYVIFRLGDPYQGATVHSQWVLWDTILELDGAPKAQ